MTIFFAESFHDLYLFRFKGLKNVAVVGSVVRRASKIPLNQYHLSQVQVNCNKWHDPLDGLKLSCTSLIFQYPDGMD